MRTYRWAISTGGLLLALALGACGGSDVPATGNPISPSNGITAGSATLQQVDPVAVEGAIDITGSSTVYPLTAAVAEAFAQDGSPANITIQSTGTGGGFTRFCDGANKIDIVNASRPLTPEEQERCSADGRPLVGFQVGTDALAVVVHPQNTFASGLTRAQLAQIFAGQARTWADVDPSYPAEPIQLFSPGTDSGTFDYFVEAIFDGDEAPLLQANPTLSEDDRVLVEGVAENRYAIGYFGFAYYQQDQDRLRVVPIEGVTPDAVTVADGSYGLARPLFIYTSPTILQSEPQVAAFIDYYLTHVNELIDTVGYFPASATTLAEARQALRSALVPS